MSKIGRDLLDVLEVESTPISYSPLDEAQDEIRLISLLPASGGSDLVRCKLETVSLGALTPAYQRFIAASTATGMRKTEPLVEWRRRYSTPESAASADVSMDDYVPRPSACRYTWGDYATLSYTWGDRRDSHAIIINGVQTRVGQNLEAALRALSQRPDFQGPYKLWVDAICINQKDVQERDQQVGKMRKIYGDAWAVISWLGEEKDDSDASMKLVQALSDASRRDEGAKLEEKLRKQPDLLGSGCWLALQALMDRRYWSRLWVIQEVVLGSSMLVLRCGDSLIGWEAFCQGIGLLQDHLWFVKDNLLIHEVHSRGLQGQRDVVWHTTSLHLIYQDLWGLSRIEQSGSTERLGFGRLLDMANAAKCQDPRDKVYGLVGMMDKDIAHDIAPDYTLAPSDVYARIAQLYIMKFGNLEPVREGNPWSSNGTPSWAADWTFRGRLRYARPIVEPRGPFWSQKGVPATHTDALPYAASGQETMKISFADDGLRLNCRGFVIDAIDGLSAREKGYFSWAEDSVIQPQHEENAYGNSAGIKRALFRALVADRVAGGERAEERHAAILSLPSDFRAGRGQFEKLGWDWMSKQEGYYFRWSRWRRANKHFKLLGMPLDSYFSEKMPDDADERTYTEVYNCVDRTNKGRRFMTTARGYLGWAPDNMFGSDEKQARSGDLIAILFGCSTPIAIRPQGSDFQVLGEAYVQGLMDGEALELWRSGKCQAQEISFC